jgi:uncharacterized membrane protein YozB (DUF420 family)
MMMDIHDLPAVNAILNGASAVLLASGYMLIRRGRRNAHHWVMTSAFTVSVVFLISYLTYHYYLIAHHEGVLHYPHAGALRRVYLTILFTHTVLAATVPVLAIITLRRAWKGDFVRHRRIARWTLPIWLYVGVTGVVVYLMLYHF